jgi:hypothetical protein
VKGPFYQVAIPDPALTITSYNAGPAGFNIVDVISTLRGDVTRLSDATQVKAPLSRATTPADGNITLSGTVSVDGANAANLTRCLVKNQTTKSENGIYVVNTGGAWSRAADSDGDSELDFAQVAVTAGTVNAGTTWFNPNQITIGVTDYDWQQYPAFGLRESDRGGPVSIAYRLPLANWYGGACTIEQGGTVVTGTRLAATGAVTADNGLIRVAFTSAGFEMEMASGSPLAWKTKKEISFSLEAELSPSIITNTPDQVVIRNRIVSTTYPKYRGSLDLAIIRGSRTVTASVSFQNLLPAFIALPNADTLLSVAAGTPGYSSTGLDHLDYENANDADGNRTGISSAVEMGVFVAIPGESPSGLGTNDPVRAVSFGVHAVVGGGATLTGADKLYEMDRAWFAMMAQQTSAGVL